MQTFDTTSEIDENPEELTRKLRRHLESSLDTLTTQTERVEHELDVETANFDALISDQNEALRSQLRALSSSVRSLHKSLGEARSDLSEAQGAAAKLDALFLAEENQTFDADEDAAESKPENHSKHGHLNDDGTYDVEMSARKASRLRHDEPITLKSVARSLLMADEPGQRERRESNEA